jgi:hypothetical protein
LSLEMSLDLLRQRKPAEICRNPQKDQANVGGWIRHVKWSTPGARRR